MQVSSLSFVFPMYNEEGNIERMVGETLRVAPWIARDYEIVIVDDASTDSSGAIADRLAAEDRHVRVVHHPVNRKLGGALKTGFAAARKEYILYMDSDLPIRMDEVPPAFGKLKGSDMVIGYRLDRPEGIRRKILSFVYNRLVRALFGLKVRDVNFSFKLFKRSILNGVKLESEGSFIDAELLLETKRHGYGIAEHGFHYRPREAGESTLSGMPIILTIFKEMGVYRKRLRAEEKMAAVPAREEGRERRAAGRAARR